MFTITLSADELAAVAREEAVEVRADRITHDLLAAVDRGEHSVLVFVDSFPESADLTECLVRRFGPGSDIVADFQASTNGTKSLKPKVRRSKRGRLYTPRVLNTMAAPRALDTAREFLANDEEDVIPPGTIVIAHDAHRVALAGCAAVSQPLTSTPKQPANAQTPSTRFNFNEAPGTPPPMPPQPIPAGEYLLILSDVKIWRKADNRSGFSLTFTIQGGSCNGRMYTRHIVQTHPNSDHIQTSRAFVVNLAVAVGHKGKLADLADLMMKPFVARIDVFDDGTKTRNRMFSLRPVAGVA